MSIHLDIDWGQANLLFLLASVGLTLCFVDSQIFYPIRQMFIGMFGWLDLGYDIYNYFILRCEYSEDYCYFFRDKAQEFTKCYMCVGFWLGLICAYFLVDKQNIYQWLACGFATSFLSLFFGTIISYIKVLDFKIRNEL